MARFLCVLLAVGASRDLFSAAPTELVRAPVVVPPGPAGGLVERFDIEPLSESLSDFSAKNINYQTL